MLNLIVYVALILIVVGAFTYGIIRYRKNTASDETSPIIGDEWKGESTQTESEQPTSENLKNKHEYVNTKLDEIKDDAIKSNQNQTDLNSIKEEVKKTPKPKTPKKVDGGTEPKKPTKKVSKKPTDKK